MQPTIYVIATTFEGTRAALATAVPLAKGSGSRLVVMVPRIVPYAVALDTQVESTAFFAKRYHDLVEELGGDARIEVCVCRSPEAVVARVDAVGSTIVLGGPAGRWLTSPEERFASRLSRLGRTVIFVASGPNPTRPRTAPSVAAVLAVVTLLLEASRSGL